MSGLNSAYMLFSNFFPWANGFYKEHLILFPGKPTLRSTSRGTLHIQVTSMTTISYIYANANTHFTIGGIHVPVSGFLRQFILLLVFTLNISLCTTDNFEVLQSLSCMLERL